MQHEMPGDDFAAFGLAAYQGAPQPMAHYHRHHEIELNLVQRGSLSYLFSATMVSVPAGQLVVFWGVLPHRVVQVTPGTIFHWLTVPLGMFLQWRLPARLTRQVLSGFPICDQDTSRAMLDQALFEQWQRDQILPGRLRTNYAPRLGDLRTPTLVVHGTHDSGVPVDQARAASRALPDATLLVVRGAGHWVQRDRPEVVIPAVMEFLRRV